MSNNSNGDALPTVKHLINGKADAGTSTRFGEITNPALGTVSAKIALANQQDVDKAVAAAKAALPTWSNMSPIRRSRIMFKFKDLLEQNIEELATLVSLEHGKLHNDAIGSVKRGIEVVEFACGAPHLLKGQYSDNVGQGVDSFCIRQPLGVCVGITPFNFPAMVPLWMYPMALICGNTFVLKPSERDPSCAIRMAELLHEAGAPEGVLNVIQGDKDAVDALITHQDVSAVSFVGSTPIAEYIYQTGTAHGKRVQALGGAKNHCVVMPDADLDQACDAIVGAAYGSAGQRCMAISVVVAVGDALAEELVAKLSHDIQNLSIGPHDDEQADFGPLVSKALKNKVNDYVELGLKEGAKLVVDKRQTQHKNGYFIGPCLFDHVTKDMRIYQEEIFGPVLSIVRVNHYEDALSLASEHEYGNGTAIFTRDGDTANDYAKRVKVGMVGINIPIPVPVAYHSFGGWKRSLFGDIHMHGPEGINFYTKLKTITSRWPKGIRQGAQFHMPTHD